jgi:hypothetical protein
MSMISSLPGDDLPEWNEASEELRDFIYRIVDQLSKVMHLKKIQPIVGSPVTEILKTEYPGDRADLEQILVSINDTKQLSLRQKVRAIRLLMGHYLGVQVRYTEDAITPFKKTGDADHP